MKYIIVLGDGMADYPVPELGSKTPLEAAYKPNIDNLAKKSLVGMVKTIPDGMIPGSDTANLAVMGYAPEKYYSGRSPLEAASIGIKLNAEDVTYRCNFVTLSDTAEYDDAVMEDYCAGEISTSEADELVRSLAPVFAEYGAELYTGVSYRHCLVIRDGKTGTGLTPPHDISLRPIAGHLPQGENAKLLYRLMTESRGLLKNHPVNLKRISEGRHPASSVWFWGEGRKPALDSFEELYGIRGTVISAVDLIKGIAICAGMESIDVEGATGNVDTNFVGKADAAISAIKSGSDFVYIHMEAPDECGHRGETENKVLSVELIDRDVVGRITEALKDEEYSMLILPDHPTPLSIRTHVGEPVPFLLYRSAGGQNNGAQCYSEEVGRSTGLMIDSGPDLLKMFLQK